MTYIKERKDLASAKRNEDRRMHFRINRSVKSNIDKEEEPPTSAMNSLPVSSTEINEIGDVLNEVIPAATNSNIKLENVNFSSEAMRTNNRKMFLPDSNVSKHTDLIENAYILLIRPKYKMQLQKVRK